MIRAPQHTSAPWRIVALLCATATAGYMCRVNVSTAGVLLMEEFGLTQVAMGGLFSAFLLGYAFFQVPAGMLADRFGARRVLGAAAWLWVGATAMQALVGVGPFGSGLLGALGMFVAWRFLLGVSEAPTYPGSAAGVSRWVLPAYQARANGIVIASIGLGSALAPPLVSHVMVRWGWRAALLASAIPALAVALVWLGVKEPPRAVRAPDEPVVRPGPDGSAAPAPSPAPAAAPAHTLRTRSFTLLTASYTLQGYVGYIFVSWFYLYLVQERGFSLLGGAWMSSLPWVLSIVSIPLGGWVADRLTAGRFGPVWGRRAVPMFGMAGSGVLIAVGAHTGSAVLAAVSLAFATALVLCVEGPFWAMMMRVSGPRSGTAGGIMNMGSNLGGLVSPALTPLLAAFIGWEAALHIAAALSVVAALLWLGIRPGAEAEGHRPPQRG
ncbi:MAG TPA: MFS transporter [Longimicrobiales bacterium]|nr:MFS transporter [Longimicrobiales bacterium]